MSFYKTLSSYYDTLFPPNPTSITFMTDQIKKTGAILDIAAGTGNHAIALAKLGFGVTATDYDEYMVQQMKAKALEYNITLSALQLKIEELSTLEDQTFETIICIGNSFVHLQSFADVQTALHTMYKLLSADGLCIIQIVNYDKVLQEKVTQLPSIEKETVSFWRTYKHKEDKILFEGKIKNHTTNETFENQVELLPLTKTQLVDFLQKAGFVHINLYGSYKGEPFDSKSSPALIAVARKS